MNKNLAKELKNIIESLEWHVSKRKGCKSVTFSHVFFTKELERLISVHDRLINNKHVATNNE